MITQGETLFSYRLIDTFPHSLVISQINYWNAAARKEKVGKGIYVSLFISLVYSTNLAQDQQWRWQCTQL